MSTVSVRMYHVGFGDCFLMTIVGDDGIPRRVLIDCGTHVGTDKDHAPDFWTVVGQLVEDLGPDRHIDVLVISHRHRDHVHGFSRDEVWNGVTVGEVWLPWTEDPKDPEARAVRSAQESTAAHAFHAMRALRGAVPGDATNALEALALNSLTNEAAFATIGGFGARTRYLPRLARLPEILDRAQLRHVLPEDVTVHVLGPSRDEAVIKRMIPPANGSATYLQLQPLNARGEATDPVGKVPMPFGESWVLPTAEARFADDPKLIAAVTAMAQSDPEGLAFNVDSAVNGTSLVLLFDIGGLRLLFAGDAQWGTWEMMLADPETKRLLGDGTDLFKVGHHGSHNATPREFVETYLSRDRSKVAMVSVSPNVYESDGWKDIPRPPLMTALAEHVELLVRPDAKPPKDDSVTRDRQGLWTEVALDGPHGRAAS